ncbi:DUF3592 domain-containing protein [Streptomyces sp. cg36]|uniref:DUF3592 domain-containing protein n=1 Tax=Streptomyces sp. cg36 TaxID=3238798 RepID=UPI0034E29119
MSVTGVLELWWTVPAAVALLGYGMSLAGLTRTQRAVWVTARIVEVGRLAHGDSRQGGIPVTVAFRNPVTGAESRLANTGKHGDSVEEAWVGRELAVRHPRGRPDLFRIVVPVAGRRSGRGGPDCAVALLLVGLVIHAIVLWGYPWALLGFGALVTAAAAASRDIRDARARDARLASGAAVPARVVAVTKDVYTDADGDEFVSHTPVIAFTTTEGTDVTVLAEHGVTDPAGSLGRELTVHYCPADPTVYTPDRAADRRSNRRTVAAIVVLLVLGSASTATGALTLWWRTR